MLAAIAADSDLTVAQKQSLTQIYETFRRENARNDLDGAASGAGRDAPIRQRTTKSEESP